MTLSALIEANLDGLLEDWIEYARVVGPKSVRFTDE